ncbi:uncharacterized protein BJX67DRAFT_365955 [Aspergillus lucknowensis]|uniref:Uncharacterized protein n=1 Tax=Aspergillus lucknowensis TaxID=176173 RepID=A0ABR4LE60_9EURO
MSPIESGRESKRSGEKNTNTTSTPYSQNFEQNLIDHRIYPPWHYGNGGENRPDNLREIKQRLAVRRPSLSQPNIDAEYEKFMTKYSNARTESQVMGSVIPFIEGNTSQYAGGGSLFNNLAPLTDGAVSMAKPDTYYGARPEQLKREIRNDLSDKIIPSKKDSSPMAPNFFTEVKSEAGRPIVARRQACYNGALGARAIHALQSYDPSTPHRPPVYDNNAYTVSSTYLDGQLRLFTSHPRRPSQPGSSPGYSMTELGSYSMTNDPEAFRTGATAYRNARDWAQEKRDEMIALANGRFSKAPRAQSENALPPLEEAKKEDI